MILLIGSQKGGSGKSTIAINLASALARSHRVAIVDADSQRTAARWHADRVANGVEPAFDLIEATGAINEDLAQLANEYDHVVVDVAGKDSEEMRSGMVIADTFVVVVRPSQFDLDTLEHLSGVAAKAKALNPDLSVRGLISQASTNPAVVEVDEALDYLTEYPINQPLATIIHDRKAYRDSVAEGRGAVEWFNRKAKAEIEALTEELTKEGL